MPFWRHPTLGDLAPERFQTVAEEAGLLGRLTERLLREACEAAAGWPRGVRLAYNLPAAMIGDTAFGLTILSVLADTGLSPTRLDVEIDEGALARDAEAALALITPLRKAGVSIIADHFGTGYSDLQNLRRLQLDGVKIDPSFVAAMTSDRQAAVMVKAMIGIGQGLDLKVIADGVKDVAQAEALALQGVDAAQGGLYGGAVDAGQAQALVAGAPPAPPRMARRG
jgi:EAL domain-containing protein (putative c-di-GMP-specific phosphodiesterase class I)